MTSFINLCTKNDALKLDVLLVRKYIYCKLHPYIQTLSILN